MITVTVYYDYCVKTFDAVDVLDEGLSPTTLAKLGM